MANCLDEKYQLVGSSEVMQRLRGKVLRVAAHGNARVLVSGPSGSGKKSNQGDFTVVRNVDDE